MNTDAKVLIWGFLVIVGVIAAFFIGTFIIAALVIAFVIDLVTRLIYNNRKTEYDASHLPLASPNIDLRVATDPNGVVFIGWQCSLPEGASIHVYQSFRPLIDINEAKSVGRLVLTSKTPRILTEKDVYHDFQAPPGILHYTPFITGEAVEQRTIAYSTFSFNPNLRFVVKRQPINIRGEETRVYVPDEDELKPKEIPDQRNRADKLTDEILGALEQKRKEDADLDSALARIDADTNLSEDEKLTAKAILESQYEK